MSLKALVAVKRVIDYNVKIRIKSDNSGVETANVKMSMNPFDEIAVEEAVKLKEKGVVGEIIVISIGEKKSEDMIRQAIAMGADRGILVETDKTTEPLTVAKIIKKIQEKENCDLIILGKQAIDDDYNQTGQMLATILDWPQATFASEVAINGKSAIVTREVDGGLQKIEITLPAVVTTDLRLNEPRYPALPNIMKARSKPMDKLTPADLGVDMSPKIQILKVEEPAKRKGGKKVATVTELVEFLKEKGAL